MNQEILSGRLRTVLTGARSVAVFTGAGMSAESGVPTFRGDEGVWKKFKPAELANFNAFMNNPDLVWEWYRHRKQVMTTIQPNAGHVALAEMEPLFPRFTVITQNIDNLHRRAGSKNVHELHGNIDRNYCVSCGRYYTNDSVLDAEHAPRCAACDGFIRPDVVWFGELLPEAEWNAAVAAAEMADLFLTVGTSAVVYPAASLPLIAKRSGAYVVEINIEPTDLSPKADEVLRGKSGEILPLMARLLHQHHPS